MLLHSLVFIVYYEDFIMDTIEILDSSQDLNSSLGIQI